MISGKKGYHHGNLKNELLTRGLKMLVDGGVEHFSFSKLARECSVTPPAIYTHFSSKENLLCAVSDMVMQEFEVYLMKTPRLPDGAIDPVEFGLAYISFFVEHPQYFDFLWRFSIHPVDLDHPENTANGSSFLMFRNCLRVNPYFKDMSDEELTRSMLSKWAMVVGLCYMITNDRVRYSGNWTEMCRDILINHLRN